MSVSLRKLCRTAAAVPPATTNAPAAATCLQLWCRRGAGIAFCREPKKPAALMTPLRVWISSNSLDIGERRSDPGSKWKKTQRCDTDRESAHRPHNNYHKYMFKSSNLESGMLSFVISLLFIYLSRFVGSVSTERLSCPVSISCLLYTSPSPRDRG